MNHLTDIDLHRIAQKSSICLNSRLVYIVPKKSNRWSNGETLLLEKHLDYDPWAAWTYQCIKWYEIPSEVERFKNEVTVQLTIKDIVLKFVKKDEHGNFVMKEVDEIDTTLYKGVGSKSGRRALKRDLNRVRKKLLAWKILNS